MRMMVEEFEPRRLMAAIAPASIAGVALTVIALDESAFPFGPYLFRATSASAYTVEEIDGPGRSSGTYSYTLAGERGAIVQFNDSFAGPGLTLSLNFSSPRSGEHQIIDPAKGIFFEQGVFLVGAPGGGVSPASIGGKNFINTISDGDGGFADEGYYRFVPSASGSYAVQSLHPFVDNSAGTYNYSKTGADTAQLTFNDALVGPGLIQTLRFLTPTAGTYRIDGDHSLTFQEGVFVVEGGRTGGPPVGGAPIESLECAVDGALPAAVVGGAKGVVSIRITNSGSVPFVGVVPIQLYASADEALDAADPTLASTTKTLRLKPGASKAVKLKFAYPDRGSGTYRLLGRAGDSGQVGVSSAAVQVAPPFVDLSGALSPAKKGKATLVLLNAGNIPAAGPMRVELFASADGSLDAADVLVAATAKSMKRMPARTKAVRLTAPAPPQSFGDAYYLIAVIRWEGAPGEGHVANNVSAVLVTRM